MSGCFWCDGEPCNGDCEVPLKVKKKSIKLKTGKRKTTMSRSKIKKVVTETMKPKKMVKGKNVFVKTKYGSYIDANINDPWAQSKNACSYKELVKAGFKPA